MIDADGKPVRLTWDYDRAEIIADAVVHAIGIVLGVAGVSALIALAAELADSPIELAAVTIYGLGMLAVLGTSAAYNLWPISRVKWWLRRFDHACIFILIAGTYTPFVTQFKNAAAAIPLLAGVWITALVGATLKIAMPGRFDRLSIAVYLLLGFSGAFAYDAVADALSSTTLWLICIGGAIYAAGVPFHLWENLRFQNAVWHGFVLVATAIFYSAVLGGVVLARA